MKRWLTRPDEMSCRQAAKVLQSFLDGELDSDRSSSLEHHLEACRDCGLELETYEEIKAALSRRSFELPPDVMQRLRRFGDEIALGEVEGV